MNALAGFRAKLAKVSSRVSVEFVQMFRIVFVALVLSGFILKGPAMAEVIDGAKLFADCRDGDDPNAHDSTYKWGTCFGYINGVADALVPAGLYCLPMGASAGTSARRRQALHPRPSGQAISAGASADC